MLFKKLQLHNVPKEGTVTNWYLILRTYEDVLQYMDVDTQLFAQALIALPESIKKSHLEGVREYVLNNAMQTAAYKLKDNETISPIEVMCNLVDNKGKAMIKLLSRGEHVLVQRTGSYCTLKGYIDTWNAIELAEVEKESVYFPTDIEATETDLLFIENSERVPVQFQYDVEKHIGHDYNVWRKEGKVKYKLQSLKFVDPNFVAQMIMKAKVIAFESQLVDNIQIDGMFKLFSQLNDKRIVIRTHYADKLVNHALYEVCNRNNTIEFI